MIFEHNFPSKTIRRCIVFLALIFLAAFSACSSGKKDKENEKQLEEFMAMLEQNKKNDAGKNEMPDAENVTLFAVVKENNVQVYSSLDDDKPIGYLHKRNIVALEKETREKVKVGDYHGNFYYFNIDKEWLDLEGWVSGEFLDIITIPKSRTTELSNSEKVDHLQFPGKVFDPAENIGLEYSPPHLDNLNDWVLPDNFFAWWGMHGLSIHLKNLPQYFDVVVHIPNENKGLRFSGEKNEFYAENCEYITIEEKSLFDRIKPLHTFYFSLPVSAVSGRYKTEILTRDNGVLFSDYFDYQKIPFRMQKLNGRNYYIQCCVETPFYLVVYKTEIDVFEKIPVSAFAVYSESDFWEGLLSLGPEYKEKTGYQIYLYEINKRAPEDYSQAIKGFWNNRIDID